MRISVEEATRIINKHPGKVPLIVETNGPLTIKKQKFLVPVDLTLAEFRLIVREKIDDLLSTEAIYMFVNNKIIPQGKTIGEIWDLAEDNCLYVTIAKENTFGMFFLLG